MAEEPLRESESISVQLTRVEGDVKLIVYQNTNTIERISHIETNIGKIELKIQGLESDNTSRKAGDLALKNASDTALRLSEKRWTPLTRVVAITSLILYLTTMYVMFKK